jgi:hypothetical protein
MRTAIISTIECSGFLLTSAEPLCSLEALMEEHAYCYRQHLSVHLPIHPSLPARTINRLLMVTQLSHIRIDDVTHRTQLDQYDKVIHFDADAVVFKPFTEQLRSTKARCSFFSTEVLRFKCYCNSTPFPCRRGGGVGGVGRCTCCRGKGVE